MNIFEKLQDCRVKLQKTELKKTGKNKFANYDYFELGDFLPRIQELLLENKLAALFHYSTEKANLTIIDTEKVEDTIVFETDIEVAQLKGCYGIQNIGATQTYARRYLYVMAFEIAEHDAIDSAPKKEEEPLVDDLKIKSLKDRMTEAGIKESQVLKTYKLKKFEDMTVKVFMDCMNKFEKIINERPKQEQKEEDCGF